MSHYDYSQSGIATFIAVAITTTSITPLIAVNRASAERAIGIAPTNSHDQASLIAASQVTIRAGTIIPMRYEEAEKIIVTKEETVPVTLLVAANIKDRYGRILIPYNSEIVGEIKPFVEESPTDENSDYDQDRPEDDNKKSKNQKDQQFQGSYFVAQELILANGQKYNLDATSQPVTRTEEIKKGANVGSILKGAAIGAAAAAVIAAITGDSVDVIEVLGGAAIGSLGGWLLGKKKEEVVSIDPNQDLDITLNSDLIINVSSNLLIR